MKVLLDLNVFLDVFQNRQPHYAASARVLDMVLHQRLTGIVPAHAITTLHYLLVRYESGRDADDAIDWLLNRFEVAPCDKESLLRARLLGFRDFEDAVVAALAERAQCHAIITRNVDDFVSSPVAALTPSQFLERFSK